MGAVFCGQNFSFLVIGRIFENDDNRSQSHTMTIPLKIVIIKNGVKKIRRANCELLDALGRNSDFTLSTYNTEFSGHAQQLTLQSIHVQPDVIIAVGGDGTFHEVVNGIRKSGRQIPVAFLPNGTANDFVLGYELTWTIETFICALRERKTTEIDLIRINFSDQIKWCLNIADTGFGGKVVQTLNKQRSWLGGKVSYVIAILRSFLYYKNPVMTISYEGGSYEGPVLLTAACNGPVFGDGLYIAPEARPNDGVMNVTILGDVNLWDYLKNLKRMKKKLPILHPEAQYLRTSFLKIQATDQNVYTESDGELAGSGDVEFAIEPAALHMLVP
jgi:YegS/Rv2252/BmrU family lipid kinase